MSRYLSAHREASRVFWKTLRNHRKRGNRHLKPLGVRLAWRAAMSSRYICLGCQRQYAPRYLLISFGLLGGCAQVALTPKDIVGDPDLVGGTYIGHIP